MGVDAAVHVEDTCNITEFTKQEYEEICEEAGANPDNILLISMNGHLTCSKYGIVYDSFDCRERIAEFCWIIK